MLWFQGSIPEAIAAAKQRKLPFVVYIEGTDEVSLQMNSIWSEPEVSELLSQEHCVAIKLANNSDQCTQFSQLYPVVCVPSTFFIGESGMPLEVIGGLVTTSELISKTNTAFQEYHSKKKQTSESSAPQPEVPDTSTEGTSSQSPAQETSASIEERVERAKQLIEKKRQEKADKEKQEQLEKETTRRDEGQKLLNAKRERENQKQRDIAAQIKEERAKDRAAREAVKEQIARDKAERVAHRQAELRERQRAQGVAAATVDSDEGAAPAATASESISTNTNYSSVRLQFRLPDGGCVTHSFPADALLEAARQFIVEHLGSGYPSITMATTYPRRQLTDEDLLQTLTALGLAPSSTIIIVPGKGSSRSPAKAGDSTGILMMLLSPLLAIFNFFYTFLLGSPEKPRGSYGNNDGHAGREEVMQDETTEPSGARRRTTGDTSPRPPATDGNIHRFRNSADDDDDNNTWNGNSTQQM